MISFILNLIISGIAVGVASYLTPGVTVNGLWPAIIVALVLGIVNATVGSVLRLITFPINFLTFGLISALISLLVLFITDNAVDGFMISNRFSGIIFCIILGIINSLFGIKKH